MHTVMLSKATGLAPGWGCGGTWGQWGKRVCAWDLGAGTFDILVLGLTPATLGWLFNPSPLMPSLPTSPKG